MSILNHGRVDVHPNHLPLRIFEGYVTCPLTRATSQIQHASDARYIQFVRDEATHRLGKELALFNDPRRFGGLFTINDIGGLRCAHEHTTSFVGWLTGASMILRAASGPKRFVKRSRVSHRSWI